MSDEAVAVPSVSQAPSRRHALAALAALVVVCTLVRLLLWNVYEPVRYPDTGTYVSAAEQIRALDFTAYTGHRPPGYPALLLLTGADPNFTWFIQSLLGLGVSVLVYLLVLRATSSAGLAFALGLLQTIALNQLLFEANMLAETLTTFLVILSVLLALKAADEGSSARAMAVVGLVSAAAALTRPQYIFLGPLYFLLLLSMLPRGARARLAWLALGFALPVLAWAAMNKVTIGYFGLTGTMGIGLAQHSSRFIDKAPAEFAVLRDTYLDVRQRRYGNAPPDHMSVWEAIPQMRAVTGDSLADLSRELTKMSLWLFVHYPADYAKGVAEAWYSFWAVPLYWRGDLAHGDEARRALQAVWGVEQPLLRGLNVAFVLLFALASMQWLRTRRLTASSYFVLVTGAVVLAASCIQALFEYSENPRYAIPTQTLAAVCAVVIVYDYLRRRRGDQPVR